MFCFTWFRRQLCVDAKTSFIRHRVLRCFLCPRFVVLGGAVKFCEDFAETTFAKQVKKPSFFKTPEGALIRCDAAITPHSLASKLTFVKRA